MNNQTPKIAFIGGGTLTIIGALSELYKYALAPYIFSVGAALIILVQFLHFFDRSGNDLRQQRLARTRLMSSLLLALAAYFMFLNSTSWVVAVLIYSLSSLFLSFRGK